MTQIKKVTFSEAINEALIEEMSQDESVVLIGNNISNGGLYGVTANIADKFNSSRIIDLPSSERSTLGFALGLAMTGAKPVVEINGQYLLRAIDVIANEIAPQARISDHQFSSSMVIRLVVGQSPSRNFVENNSFENLLADIDGINVVYPSTAVEAKGVIKTAIRDNGVTVVIENFSFYEKSFNIPEGDILMDIRAAEVKAIGDDITLISYGIATKNTYNALRLAADRSVNAELIDLRCLNPIDVNTIVKSVKKTSRALIVTEGTRYDSVSAKIVNAIMLSEAFDYLDAPVKVLYSSDHADYTIGKIIPTQDEILEAILETVGVDEE